ncbi:SN protein, partial [Rhynochetos jubatus]|nr:SN protein [Rhynochetos jubatus]
PTVAASEEQTEGETSTLECSTPYVCPLGNVALRWEGYDPQVSAVSGHVQLDTSGVGLSPPRAPRADWDSPWMLLHRFALVLCLKSRTGAPSWQGAGVGEQPQTPPASAAIPREQGAPPAHPPPLPSTVGVHFSHPRDHSDRAPISPSAAKILVSPAAEVQEGTATTLSCDVPGGEDQDLSYTWYKNGAWLRDGPAHTLLFHRVAPGDAGYYSCKVANSWGSDMAKAVSLSVTYPPRSPTLTFLQETQGGRLAIIGCAVASHPPATMALYHNGILVAASGSQVPPQQRFSIAASPNVLRLEIRGMGPEDSGEYRCTASNAYGNASVSKPFLARATEVLIQPSSEVREGAAVTLSCLGAWGAAEETLYTWYRNGKWLRESSEPTLRFPSIRAQDAGAFQCSVRSSNGSDTSAVVPLRVLFPPRRPEISSFLESQSGLLGIILCTVESDPEANLTLWRGDEQLACTGGCPTAPNPRVHATVSHNSVRVEIREVVAEDEGLYVCQAGNTQGNASAAMDFRA